MSYPLTFPNDDPRFTDDLIDAVAQTLADHGYPPITGDTNAARLRGALARFLYGPEFNTDDCVAWYGNGKVWRGVIEVVANTDKGPVARVSAEPQSGYDHRSTTVIACSELTLISRGGAR